MGGPLCENKIWDFFFYNKCYLNSNDLGVISFRMWVVWYCFFEFINFRPGRDFINGRGLLIQGGDYFVGFLCFDQLCLFVHLKHLNMFLFIFNFILFCFLFLIFNIILSIYYITSSFHSN